MGLFDNMLNSNQTLFKNIDALDFAFVPKIIPYREEQQRRIATAIQPLFADRNGKNIVIYGMPGIGKTVACRHVLNELEEKTEDITPIYVNCWEKNTSYKVALALCEEIRYVFTQNKKTDELFKEVIKGLNKRKVVIVFDEIDKAEDYDFLYILAEQVYRKTIIMITNFRTFLEDMDERVRSRIMPELIEFKPYNLEETKGILKQRIEYAFFPNVWETDAFELVANRSFDLHDVRVGIHLLKDCAEQAEQKSSKKITYMHAKDALAKIDEYSIAKSTDLDSDDKKILELIKKNTNSKIGDLFKLYSEAGGSGVYKTFQRKMKQFEEQNLIKCTRMEGAGGNTTIIEYVEKKEKTKGLNEF